jgi:uroporphyrinogen-III decarboxylase
VVGAEYATPPYLPPECFAEYVVPYDREMTELIHRHGGWARIHCHGKIANVVEHLLAIGADSLDPVEPPPQGDIEFAEAKRRLGERMTLMGNLELAMLETASAEQVRAEVRKTMKAGRPGGRFVLMPTAAPIDVPLNKRTEENYLAFMETAKELGEY